MATFKAKKMRWRSSRVDMTVSRPQQPQQQPLPKSEGEEIPSAGISDPYDVSQQSRLTLGLFKTELTGEPRMGMASGLRYMAPVYLPSHLQKDIMPALLSDPWPSVGEAEQRRRHAELIVRFLRGEMEAGGQPMTALSILGEINSREGVTFSSEAYVKALLEHLRVSRMIKAHLNPSVTAARAAKSASVRDLDPLMYTALPYQQEEFGSPAAVAIRKSKEKRLKAELAYQRLRRSKAPIPIHRRIAYGSAFSHELGQIEISKWQAKEEARIKHQGPEKAPALT